MYNEKKKAIRIHEDRIDEVIGQYEGDPARQNAALAELFEEYGLDISKPHLMRIDAETLEWRFRQDPNGHVVTASDFPA